MIKALLLVSTSFATIVAAPALAQDASESAAVGGEEIIVTALKRANSAQDVAATVSVISSDQLAASGIASIEQLRSVAPGVIIQRAPNNTISASIRGIGTTPGPVSFDQGIAQFVDGVYAARGADFLSALFDIERIEVVKGTQAAVLGKNTSLGAIVLTSRKPGSDFAADVTANYEFVRNSVTVAGGIDVPVSPEFAVRIAGQFQDIGGYETNLVTVAPAERDARHVKENAVRVTGVWTPTDDLDVTLSFAHEELRSRGIPVELIADAAGNARTLFNLSGYGNLFETNIDFRYAIRNNDGPSRLYQPSNRATGTINYDLGNATLTSVTGWSRFDQRRYTDNDYTPGNYYSDTTNVIGEQFSQELRISSDGAPRLGYIVGALYVRNTLDQDQTQTTNYPAGILPGPGPMVGSYNALFSQKTTTWSGFGQLTYDITDKLTATGGVRATTEKKTADMQRKTLIAGRFTNINNPAYALTHLSRQETVVDYSAALEYHVTDKAMVYASYGQGTKGGGFSDFGIPATAEYKKEVARTAEIGFKLEGDDRSWHLNAALFNTKVKDFQNNFFNGSNFVVQNLKLVANGAELDAYWSPVPNLNLKVEGTYVKARNESQPAGVDKRFPRSPRLSGRAALDYSHEVRDDIEIYFGADVIYRSKISHQPNPNAVLFGDPFATINGNFGLRNDVQGWDIGLIGRNVANAKSLGFASPVPFTPGAQLGIPEEGRTVAVQFRLKI